MYDEMIGNKLAGSALILEDTELNGEQLTVGYNHLESEKSIMKYFVITGIPMYMRKDFFSRVRTDCIMSGVKVNFYTYTEPHKIRWESPEMESKLRIWREATKNRGGDVSAFDYRKEFSTNNIKDAIISSTMYFNKAELVHRRTLCKVVFMVEFSCDKDEESVLNMTDALKQFKKACANDGVKTREIKTNVADWLTQLGMFSLRSIKEVLYMLPKRVVTDDVIAQFSTYKQGRLGESGVPLGMDMLSGSPVLRKFKEDPDSAENWLIAAQTGGGKSFCAKALMLNLLADGFVVTIMDYEGDEYTNIALYLAAANPEDVKIISMGKGSAIYFDPMEIADLTGDAEIDDELKETAVNYVIAIFRLIVGGLEGGLNNTEERVISTAIKNVYDNAGVSDDKSTWRLSRGLRVRDVYRELIRLRDSMELIDEVDIDKLKHRAVVSIVEAAFVYFETGEAKAGTFAKPMSVNELYKAKLIIFQFGMRGAVSSQIDPIVLALKQLSVASVSIQVSNHCKYVRKCFNVKLWEEYQRWGAIKGSAEIIINAMTGGRKRGDVNVMITNNLSEIIDDGNEVSNVITQNLQGMMVGGIHDKVIRDNFCSRFGVQEISDLLARIGRANNTKTRGLRAGVKLRGNRYKYAFCVIMGSEQAVIKVQLPDSLGESQLFSTGVNVAKKD